MRLGKLVVRQVLLDCSEQVCPVASRYLLTVTRRFAPVRQSWRLQCAPSRAFGPTPPAFRPAHSSGGGC
jgi:hypothetical protein